MNLNEERNYQKMMEILDALELTEKNRQLAEQYLDVAQPEKPELLAQVELQDFSVLDKEKRQKCTAYWKDCKRRKQTENISRYVQFTAAVGGSTASFVLTDWMESDNDLNFIKDYLTEEMATAIWTESKVWNSYCLEYKVDSLKEKEPEILRKAKDIYSGEAHNTRILLSGFYLASVSPVKPQDGCGEEQEKKKQIQETVDYLINRLVGNICGTAVSEEDVQILRDFVHGARTDEPVPESVYSILRGKQFSEYRIALLGGSAFLAIEHSEKFTEFLRLTSIMDMENKKTTTLNICKHIHGEKWFDDHIEALEDRLLMSRQDYILWCAEYLAGGPVRRLSVSDPETVMQSLSAATADQFLYLLKNMKEGNPEFYQKRNEFPAFRTKMVKILTQFYRNGCSEARKYLLGKADIDVLFPLLKDLRDVYRLSYRVDPEVHALKNSCEQMYRRSLVLLAITLEPSFFRGYWVCEEDDSEPNGQYGNKLSDKRQIQGILQLLEEEHVPAFYQLEVLAWFYEYFYPEEYKAAYLNGCLELITENKEKWKDALTAGTQCDSICVRELSIRALDMYWQEHKDTLLACAQDSSKQVCELLVDIYGNHKEWEPEILSLLGSRKAQMREIAVRVLKKWGAGAYQAELSKVLEKEKSKKVKELIQDCLGSGTDAEQKEKTADELAAELLKGGRKRKVAWAYEKPFPQVHKLDNTVASEDYMQALLVAYADMSVPGVSADAAKLAGELDAGELSSYMNMLFTKWMESGAEAKKKWVLYAVSIHGGEAIVPVLYAQIQEWPNAARGAIAAEAVKALALNGGSTALLLVDQISRKFKFRQVKAAASDAMDYAAEQLGITKAELEDRIVPNLGFDERMEQVFDYGTRKFTVVLTPALELQVTDEGGKKLKSLPAPGKRDEEEKAKAASSAFKLLKKQLKTVVANQKLRLEQALSTERLWTTVQWTELFVKNPVMHQFATGLIWGLYENGELKDTFRYMEDGSFNTVDEDEYDFPENGMIGLVHPIELEKETLEAWKEQLSDYEITQPIEQLERTVYQVTEEEMDATELTRFGGKVLNSLSLSGKLLGMGWYRGSVQDAGGYYTFYREDGEIGVELEFSGAYVGYDNGDVTVYGVQFYRAGTVKRGSYEYDTVKKEDQYTLDQVSPRYFSEIVLQLTKATASSQEQFAYPECKER